MIKQADAVYDNIFRGGNVDLDPDYPEGVALGSTIIENVNIIGKGRAILEGSDVTAQRVGTSNQLEDVEGDQWGWKCITMHFGRVNNIVISNLEIYKTKNWAVSFEFCEYVKVTDLFVDSRTSNTKNGDGIDLRDGTKHVEITRMKGYTQDDCIALSCLPRLQLTDNSTTPVGNYSNGMLSNESFYATKEESYIEDVTITDCELSSNTHAIIILAMNFGGVRNVRINNIRDYYRKLTHLQFIRIYAEYGQVGSYNDDDIHTIRMSNIVSSDNSKPTLQITCKTDNVWLNKIVNTGGGVTYHSNVAYTADVTITNTINELIV